jgi:rhodanese-related sulfurtransferase
MVDAISPSKAAEIIANQHVDIVDVRDENEWVAGHIPGARLVPLDQLRADPEHTLTHDSIILFVCAKGARSLTAAKLADRLGGYGHVYSLDGGTKEWARAGLPLVVEQRAAA